MSNTGAVVSERQEYRFRIKELTPEAISQKRLGEYLLALARLYGEPDHVHFGGVRAGSAVLQSWVDPEAGERVRARMREVGRAAPTSELGRIVGSIDFMLREDGASAVLRDASEGHNVVAFRGASASKARIGPVVDRAVVEGELVRVGGADRTAHALVRTEQNQVRCQMSRELARRLAAHLYETVRISGAARWYRNPDGTWEIEELKADDFTVVVREPLASAVRDLKAIPENGWSDLEDPLAEATRLRRA